MKRLSLFYLFLLGISVSFANNDMLLEKISVEDRISRQVHQELEKILPKNSFTVFASASLIQENKKEVSQGEVFKQKFSPALPAPSATPVRSLASAPSFGDEKEVLPGFTPLNLGNNYNSRNNNDAFMQKLVAYIDRRLDNVSPTSTQKETYHFVKDYKLRKVLVDVLVDKRVADKQYDLAEDSLIKKMRASFGNQVSVRFQKANLMSYDPPPTFSEKLVSLLKQNWLGLLFMVLGLIFLFSLLTWLFHRTPSSLNPQYPYPYPNMPQALDPFSANRMGKENEKSGKSSGEESAGEEEDEMEAGKALKKKTPFVNSKSLQNLLEKFIDQLVEDPLLSRHFLRQLESEDKGKLLKCFNTHGMQENLKRTIDLSPLESDEAENIWENMDEDELNADKHELLVKIHNELRQYRKVMGVQLKRKFGYLALLDDKELKHVFDEVPVRYLSGVTRIMPSQQREHLLQSLPVEKKKELFTFLTSNEKNISMEELKEYNQELKHKVYDVINTASGSDSISNTSIMDSLVSEVQDAHYILSDDLMRENTVLADKYKHHRVTFNQFLLDNQESILNCLDDASNEVVAQSLLTVDEGQAQNLLNFLSSDRRTLVGSLMLSLKVGEYAAQSEIAQNEILKNYKNYLYSRSAS